MNQPENLTHKPAATGPYTVCGLKLSKVRAGVEKCPECFPETNKDPLIQGLINIGLSEFEATDFLEKFLSENKFEIANHPNIGAFVAIKANVYLESVKAVCYGEEE